MKLFHLGAGMNPLRIRVCPAGKGIDIPALDVRRPQSIGLISKDRQP
jgi:hypothetical protein